jgi:hypothetical protein
MDSSDAASQNPRLYSYVVRTDDGAAPNPFGGICTLAICKPKIRSTARVGDWVAGVGSKNARGGNLTGHLVYAMQISDVMSLAEYDRRAPAEWPHRIPDMGSKELARRLGDCIYDFSDGEPKQRRGVHGEINVPVDLGGMNALVSRERFFYFGREAIALPEHLAGICPPRQGHRSFANEGKLGPFVEWLESLGLAPGQLHGWPDVTLKWDEFKACGGCIPRSEGHGGEC